MFGELAGWLIMLGAWVAIMVGCLLSSGRIINRNDDTYTGGNDNGTH